MRDIVLTVFVFGSVPFIFKRPYYGLLMWVWLSLMSPNRLSWGFAYNMPFAQVIGLATLGAMLARSKTLYKLPINATTLAQFSLVAWIGISPLLSLGSSGEFDGWLKVFKIQLMVLITFFLVATRDEIHKLAWVLALSVGFFGIKGGMFTIATGGNHKVWGPDGSFIGDNNTLALAVLMTVPLFRYLQLHSQNPWVRRGCVAAMLLCVASAVGSHSRGALLALGAMGVFFWWKSRNKVLIGALVFAAVPLIFAVMPESWTERMNSIKTYDQDRSAMGRINAWWQAWNIAVARFPIGGGFDIYTPELFARFSPEPEMVHAAHSIYFQILGNHGFGGLFLWLAIFVSAWLAGGSVVRQVRGRKDFDWAGDLAAMLQVCLICYAVGGAFLSLSYYDFPYYVAALIVVLREHVKREIDKPVPVAASMAVPRARGSGLNVLPQGRLQ